MAYRSIVDDPALGVPSPLEYGWNFFGGKILSETGSLIFNATSIALSIKDISTALSTEELVFDELVNGKTENGTSRVNYGENKRQLVLNEAWVTEQYGDNSENSYKNAADYIESLIIMEWNKINPKLYEKIYEPDGQFKSIYPGYLIPDNTRVHVNYDVSSMDGY